MGSSSHSEWELEWDRIVVAVRVCWEHFAPARPHVSALGLCLFFVVGCL